MKKSLLVASVIGGSFILLLLISVIWGVSRYNTARSLHNQYDALARANEASFDNMWKKINQTAQATDAQKNALKEIFNGYAATRSGNGNGGQIMTWLQESVPAVDTTVYRNLQNIIAGSRDEWTVRQIALVDVAREYNQMLVVFPSNLLLGAYGFQKINARVVTSGRTDKAFSSGKDDDVNLGVK